MLHAALSPESFVLLHTRLLQQGQSLRNHTIASTYRFVSEMPTPALFTVFSFLLRIVEGTGTAMYTTVSYAMLTRFYPEKKGTIVVSGYYLVLLHFCTLVFPDGISIIGNRL